MRSVGTDIWHPGIQIWIVSSGTIMHDVLLITLSNSKPVAANATEFPTFQITINDVSYFIFCFFLTSPAYHRMFSHVFRLHQSGDTVGKQDTVRKAWYLRSTRSNPVPTILRLSSSWLSALVLQLPPRVLPLLAPVRLLPPLPRVRLLGSPVDPVRG